LSVVSLPPTWGIAFIDSSRNVYSVEAGKAYRITSTGNVQSLRVSPYGTQLQWMRSPAGSPVLVVHTYDLSQKAQLALLPFWSRDGSKIAVLAPGHESSLWVCRAGGSSGRMIRYAKVN